MDPRQSAAEIRVVGGRTPSQPAPPAAARICVILGPIVFILSLLASTALAEPSTVEGAVERWRDGDTPILIVDGERMPVRLWGLHAPEEGEPGYLEAREYMERLVGSQVLECRLTGRMTWGRHEGSCYLAGQDIAAALIRAGFGRDCPRHSGGRYAGLETAEGRRLPLPGYCAPRN